MGWSRVVRGQSRSLEIAAFDRAHTSSCQPSTVFYVSILHRFRDIAIYWFKKPILSFQPTSSVVGALVGGDLIGITPRSLVSAEN